MQSERSARPVLDTSDALLILGGAILKRHGTLRRPITMGFAVHGDGAWTLDTSSPELVRPGWSERLDVQIFCNGPALTAFALGRLDPAALTDEQVFACEGDLSVFAELARAFGETQSLIGLRAGLSKNQ